jgi:hypothetical protein
MPEKQVADIPEAYFEYRADFSEPMFSAWSLPNEIVKGIFPFLQSYGVGLQDIEWSKDPKSFKELQVTFKVLKLNAVVHVGIDSTTFVAINPDWTEAAALIELFEKLRGRILEIGHTGIERQETALAMHVKPSETPFPELMKQLVNQKILGTAEMYGVSTYNGDSSMVIDKSLRYENSVFIRLHRKFPPSVTVKEIATALYEDEMRALGLLGLQELLENR